MLTSLQLVSITDFVLSLECLFLSGILFGKTRSLNSAQGMLSFFLLFAGIATFMGGLDHGFFQPIDKRFVPTTLTYISIAFATFFLFRYIAITFFNKKVAGILQIIAYIQLVVFIGFSFTYHNFLLVIGNYSPLLLLFFILNLVHLKDGKSNWYIVLFCISLIVATVVQASGIKLTEMLNEDTMYHLISMLAYMFFYIGAVKLLDKEKVQVN